MLILTTANKDRKESKYKNDDVYKNYFIILITIKKYSLIYCVWLKTFDHVGCQFISLLPEIMVLHWPTHSLHKPASPCTTHPPTWGTGILFSMSLGPSMTSSLSVNIMTCPSDPISRTWGSHREHDWMEEPATSTGTWWTWGGRRWR